MKIKLFKKESLIIKRQLSVCILLLAFFQISLAQDKISLETAIETALKNNNSIKNEKLKADYLKALIQSNTDIPKTIVFGEFGQINSNYADTKFGISQSFALPTVYKRQKEFLKENYNSKILQTNLQEFEVKKTVTQLFYNYLTLKEKEKLLQKADTLFSKFFDKANLRFQKGESNILEKATAENQKTNVNIQLKELQLAIEILKLEFQLVLNSQEMFLPNASGFKAILIENKIEENPNLKIYDQQKKLIATETALQKSKLLPEIMVGYNNNSFAGIGLDDSQRFHSAQLGLGIPLFGRSQKTKINALKIAESAAESEYQNQVLNLKNEFNKLMVQYQSNLEITNLLENQSIKNSKLISDVTNKQFINGEINYLDFVALINQSTAIQNTYIESVMKLNNTIISLNYINLKN